jgi:hypothetical protein
VLFILFEQVLDLIFFHIYFRDRRIDVDELHHTFQTPC